LKRSSGPKTLSAATILPASSNTGADIPATLGFFSPRLYAHPCRLIRSSSCFACRVLDVSWSGFYAWRDRPPSPRAVRHAWLADVIREVHVASYGSYGARRVYAELTLGRGIEVGHNAVTMLMQRAGIAGRNGAPIGPRSSS